MRTHDAHAHAAMFVQVVSKRDNCIRKLIRESGNYRPRFRGPGEIPVFWAFLGHFTRGVGHFWDTSPCFGSLLGDDPDQYEVLPLAFSACTLFYS